MSNRIQSHKQQFFVENSLKTKAKMYIRKHPGIYIGNLTYRLGIEIPTATKTEISIVYLQLMNEGFCMDICAYPPENADNKDQENRKIGEGGLMERFE